VDLLDSILSLERQDGILSPFTLLLHNRTALRVGATRLENKTDATRNIAEEAPCNTSRAHMHTLVILEQ